jgi:uncharacterized protein (DUF2236 family)
VVGLQVNAERLVLLGWSRAILLQAAHPLVAAGIADHSQFRSSARTALRRLYATVGAMRQLAFGDAQAHAGTIEAIRHVHRRVRGVLREPVGPFPAGTRYSAEDPALVLWVHATLLESTLAIYEQLVRPLSDDERNEYCADARDVACELGAEAERVPRTWTDLERYLEAEYASGRIVVGHDARAIGDALLFPPLMAVPPPFAWANRVVTLGLLPATVRRQYRYGWSDARARQLDRVLGALRRLRRFAPPRLAWWSDARRALSGPRASGLR